MDWFHPVDGIQLGVFRMLFGGIMVWEVVQYFHYSRIEEYYIDPILHFTFPLFGFVSPLRGEWMYLSFVLLGGVSLLLCLGLFYRLAALLFFLTYTYIFLCDSTQYNNHYYFISLIGFLLILVQANRCLALDGVFQKQSRLYQVPFWNLFLLRFQIVIVYFFGGIAKLSPDWLAGEPMRHWLYFNSAPPSLKDLLTSEVSVYFFSYGGLLFDLLIGFLLLARKTRIMAIGLILFFNLSNAFLFQIGIFPYLMIATTVLFVDSSILRRILGRVAPSGEMNLAQRVLKIPSPGHRMGVYVFLSLYCAYQILFPLRHWVYPGDVNWNEEGHRFSWHMKLRDKRGSIAFLVKVPGKHQEQMWNLKKYLTDRQIYKMTYHPDMILQFAHFIRDKLKAQGIENPSVRVLTRISLNYKPYRPLVDPTANFARLEFSPILFNHWILPFNQEDYHWSFYPPEKSGTQSGTPEPSPS